MRDVIIIGGGPSGLMSSIFAAKKHKNVLLLEKTQTLGKKILLSGGGRCNVTNNCSIEELINNIPRNGKFLYSALNNFSNQDLIKFFNDNGVELIEQDHKRMFPKTQKASTIADFLINQAKSHNVELRTDAHVISCKKTSDGFIVKTNSKEYKTKNLILATGGKSYAHLGTTGEGYEFAKRFDHKITELFPTETPLVSNQDFIKNKELMGLSLQEVTLSLLGKKNKVVKTHTHDLIFTHFGLSGPCALRMSMFVQQVMKKLKTNEVTMHLDCLPSLSTEDVQIKIKELILNNPNKQIKNLLGLVIPSRLAVFIAKELQIDELNAKSITKAQVLEITNKIKSFEILIHGVGGFKKAFVTGGGVSCKEINPKTMESKITPNLYFCGELMDVNGYTGGFNITTALISGYTAGTNV